MSAGLLDLLRQTESHQSVTGLELLQRLVRVVDQGEASALATTVLSPEAEDRHLVLVRLVQLGKLLTELILGDIGAVGVEDIPAKEIESDSVQSNSA